LSKAVIDQLWAAGKQTGKSTSSRKVHESKERNID
jgi:hypothetical protein